MNDRRADSGFTLLEVLVALAIAMTSFVVLFKVISSDLQRTREARDETVAIALLQSLLAQSEIDPKAGVAAGTAPNGYTWRVDIVPYDEDGHDATWPVDAVNIAATVSWKSDGVTRSQSLSTLHVMPKAAAR
ncbi:MAG TPA: type II secretion system protein [Rhizomicrobium sp.]|jgi:type II secretion system protein I